MNKSRHIITALLCICALTLHAVPAKRERCMLTLKDGTRVEATAMGDEHLHYYVTDDKRYLLCDAMDIARYVEEETVKTQWQARAEKRQAMRDKHSERRRARGQADTMTGTKRGIVMLVDFPDVPFHYDAETFNRLFNEIGYSDGFNAGSVRDYFLSASYGQFDFVFDVVGPVTMSQPLAYYGANDAWGYDVRPATMVAEAIAMLDDEVDFSTYDWDDDGEVEQVYVIHSGYDEAQRSASTNIWSHSWTLTEAQQGGDGNGAVTADGVLIDKYATSAELTGKSGYGLCGIGTACHEFSHCFGLPDVYDTWGNTFGMDSWSIMDYGEYNGDGGTPAGFTSYERMFCGWLQPIELTEAIVVENMPPLTSEPVAYIMRNSGKPDEYYLLENRQQESWDRYLEGHGMLILHIDYDEWAWDKNSVNINASHPHLTIIPADNIRSATTLAGDTWPGTTRKTELSNTTLPAASLYNYNAEGTKMMNHSLSGIRETADGLIGFTFDENALGIAAPPRWQSVQGSGAIYNLKGQQVQPQERGLVIKPSANGKYKLTTTIQ